MLSDFHQAKLRHHHEVCDYDKTGTVSQQDFESIADRFAELRGEAPARRSTRASSTASASSGPRTGRRLRAMPPW